MARDSTTLQFVFASLPLIPNTNFLPAPQLYSPHARSTFPALPSPSVALNLPWQSASFSGKAARLTGRSEATEQLAARPNRIPETPATVS